MKEIEQLKEQSFKGFITIDELKKSCKAIPKEMGVYVVLREKDNYPVIFDKRPFDCQEDKYPSYTKLELENIWVEDTQIIYIGKAGGSGLKTELHKRLSTYIRFGKGKKATHGGGRSIWQLADVDDFVVCWKVLTDGEPSDIEHNMIAEFAKEHNGMLPFANRKN